MKSIVSFFCIVISIVLFAFSLSIESANLILFSIIFVYFGILIRCSVDWHKNLSYLLFVSFVFAFLLSRTFYRWTAGMQLEEFFSDTLVYDSLKYITVSLLTIYFGMILFGKKYSNESLVDYHNEENHGAELSVAKVLFYCGAICKIYITFVKIVLINTVGYVSSYLELTDTIKGVPYIISKFSDIYLISFIIILALLPDYQKIKKCVWTFLFVSILGIFTGVRSSFFLPLVFLFWYLSYINYFKETRFKDRITGKKILLLILGLYVCCVLIGLIGKTRVGQPVTAEIFNPFKTIAENIGGSNLVLIRTFQVEDSVSAEEGITFLFGPFLNFFNNNVFTQMLFPSSVPAYGTVEYALNGRNFGSYLTYTWDRAFYMTGGGYGSSYIAEAYIAGGYLAIVIITLLYAYFLALPYKIRLRNWISRAIVFTMMYSLFYASRDAALYFLTSGINITNLFVILVVYLLGSTRKRGTR